MTEMVEVTKEEAEEEEESFFDSKEEITSTSDGGPDSGEGYDLRERDFTISDLDLWIRRPESVQERRERFLRQMGLRGREEESDSDGEDSRPAWGLRASELHGSRVTEEFSSMRSSESSVCEESTRCSSMERIDVDIRDLMLRIRNLDDGREFVIDREDGDENSGKIRELASDRFVTVDEFHKYLGYSSLVQTLMRRDYTEEGGNASLGGTEVMSPRRRGWLKHLRSAICKRGGEFRSLSGKLHFVSENSQSQSQNTKAVAFRKVKVHSNKKNVKELSAVYQVQEIHAHNGLILTMKFSLDGQFLASAGEDGVVRVWRVIESAQTELNLDDPNSSCLHFKLNDSSELTPILVENEKGGNLRKRLNTSCAIIPPGVFRLSEKPVHEFKGHSGGVLDLCWSHSKRLLSSSMDGTVRLWQLGSDKCHKVFPHNNYVTCVQFHPIDERYFISGSIDGKVRIWSVPDCHVVDWTEIREMITAVSYSPNGQVAVVGSMSGNCRFYSISDNSLQLETEVCIQRKKKSPGNRITGFQFHPDNPQEVMVTSADSQVRILDNFDLVCKYKGFRNASSHISATFTSQGRHIISASEDSHVYIWNHDSQGSISKPPKSIRSWERFHSSNVSVATSWSGPKVRNFVHLSSGSLHSRYRSSSDSLSSPRSGSHSHWDSCESSPLSTSSPKKFSFVHGGFFDNSLLNGCSATWPEEKLPLSSKVTVGTKIGGSQYKCLKNACINSGTAPYAWGLVIVTAGWDGRLRTFQNFGLPARD